MYLKDPKAIEEKSFDFIRKGIDKNLYSREELEVVKRVVHATADFEFARLIKFNNGAVEAGIRAIRMGCNIVTDTRMARAGIKRKLARSFGIRVRCYASSKEAEKMAEKNMTRAMAAVILSSRDPENKIFVIGNAPTALFKLNELVREGKVSPALVVGVPVGFVGAKESKEELLKLPVPSIVVRGCKGGTPVAVAIVNALLLLAERRDGIE